MLSFFRSHSFLHDASPNSKDKSVREQAHHEFATPRVRSSIPNIHLVLS